MNRYPITKEEEGMPTACWSGRKCSKCDCKEFNIKSGHGYAEFKCVECGEIEEWSFPDEE